jgi:hypothetical protein
MKPGMMLHAVARMWKVALVSLALLGAIPASADPVEELYLSREELPDGVLRGLLGVATVQVFAGTPWVLPRFEPGASGFVATGEVVLVQTQAVSGWTYADEALRRYPVVDRKGAFLQVILDARTGERAWLQEQPELGPRPTVSFHALDAEGLEGSGIDLHSLLAPDEGVTFYEAPSPGAPRVRGIPEGVVNMPGLLRWLRREGDFVLIGADRGLTEEVQALGWVRLKDTQGTLRLWPMWPSGC